MTVISLKRPTPKGEIVQRLRELADEIENGLDVDEGIVILGQSVEGYVSVHSLAPTSMRLSHEMGLLEMAKTLRFRHIVGD